MRKRKKATADILEINSFLSVCGKNGGFIEFLLGHVTCLKGWPPGSASCWQFSLQRAQLMNILALCKEGSRLQAKTLKTVFLNWVQFCMYVCMFNFLCYN